MNVVILAAGSERADENSGEYPLCLAEFDGRPLIENTIASIHTLKPSNFIFCFKSSDIREHHLDDITSILAPGSQVIGVKGKTGGAACTALLAATFIDSDEELLIINGNELLEIDFRSSVEWFKSSGSDVGVITFPSVHPRYSYVRVDEDGFVVEAAEKRPISRMATAGFYWFKHGKDFVRSAKSMIRKDASVNGVYYICPTLNEMVLEHKHIRHVGVSASAYHPLKTNRQLQQYEYSLSKE
jgi:NDP-sugar pyrophosphorylase family protein